jgi:hypothetical protein
MYRMPTQLAKQTVRRTGGWWEVSMIQVHEPVERVEIVAFGPRGRQIELHTTNFANALMWMEKATEEVFKDVFHTPTFGTVKPENQVMTLTTHDGRVVKTKLLE